MKPLEHLGQAHITSSAECRAAMVQAAQPHIPPQRTSPEDFLYNEAAGNPTRLVRGIAKIAGAEVIYTYEEPGEVVDPVPLLLTPGYCGIKSSYRQLRHHIALQGKPAISYRPARTQKFPASFQLSHLRDVTKLPSQVAWGVMRDVAEQHDKNLFDIAGHSFGGKTATDAANHKPEYVRSVLLVASVGLHGPIGLKEMRSRGRTCITGEIVPNLDQLARQGEARMALEAVHYIVRNPLRTLREGIAAGSCDIRRDVANLRQLGIKIGGLLFPADSFFHPEDVERHSGYLFDVLKQYADSSAMHVAPQLTPKPVAQALMDITRELNSTSLAA